MGKIKLPLNVALCLYPTYLASIFHFTYATTYRHLQIGSKSFWLRYIGKTDWRSNYGEVDIKLIKTNDVCYDLDYPLFAIDFIESVKMDIDSCYTTKNPLKQYLAIDFNTSPQIRGTGVENILPAKEVAKLIIDFKNKDGILRSIGN